MSIFREYDIRGVVGKDLTLDVAESIGRAYATSQNDRIQMGVRHYSHCF